MNPNELVNAILLCENTTDSVSNLWLYYQNVRGLKTKIDELFVSVCECNFDIIFMTETGLDENINSLQLFGPDYNVFRCDRSPQNSTKTTFGGVLIAVTSNYRSITIRPANGKHLEQVCVVIEAHGKKIFLCNIYIAPDCSRNTDVYDAHLASVRELCDTASDDDIIVVYGDYNQPHIAWDQRHDGLLLLDSSLTTAATAALVDGIDSLCLRQCNLVENYRNRILDLVFCFPETKIIINEATMPLLSIDSHHPPLVMSIPTERKIPNQEVATTTNDPNLNHAKINFVEMNDFLKNCN